MRIAALVLLGAICLTRLPVDLLPKVTLPTVAVSTTWPNVAPEEIESQVTRPVEEAVSAAPNLYQVNSTTTEGSSLVRVQFQWGTDIGQAAVDVLQLAQRAQRLFPSDPTLQTPTVFKFDPTQLPILIYGVSGEDDPVKLRTLLDDKVSPMLESANGVASAVVAGGDQRAIMVNVDPVRLQAHDLSLATVLRRIAQENVNLPAGIAKQSDTEYVIRSLGWFLSPGDIGRVPLGTYNGQLVRISDVAEVRDSHPETRIYTRFNGEPAVGIIISKQSGANTVATAKAVAEKIRRVRELYPNLKFGLAYNQAQYIGDSITDVKVSALIGGVLAVLILLFFLRNIRSTLVVALSIPTSIISTFALLYLCGFTLNTMSLGGLALSTGLIVDDAVVVLENIFRHIERDRKKSFDAAVDGTNEIMSAVFASTWTVMVVFLPLLLIRGQAGQMFTQFALVVVFALAISLLDATTVVPMLAHRLISGEAHAEALEGDPHARGLLARAFHRFGLWFDALDRSYREALQAALRRRAVVVVGAAVVTLAALLLIPHIGSELMPQTDSGDFTVRIKMPVGTALAKTNETMQRVEKIVRSNPDVETAFAAAGSTLSLRGTTTSLTPYQGSVTVKLRRNRKQSTLQVIGDLRRKLRVLPGVTPLLNQTDLVTMIMTGGNQNVEVDIFGQDLGTLSSLSKEVMTRVRDIVGFENIDVNWQEAMPEVQWHVDREKANQLGLSFTDIADTINTATNGTIASYYQEKGFEYPIIVQLPEQARKTVSSLQDLVIMPSAAGTAAPGILLSQVARPVYATGPNQITRQDRQRYIAVSGAPQGRSAGEIQADIQKALADMRFPTGYYWDWGTNQKRRHEEFSGLGLAVALAIGLIYMLLASQFEAFLHPLTILLTVPLAGIGMLLALFVTDRAFGLTAFVGALMLVGIVVKNGILLVDYTNHLRRQGLSQREALLRAGPTRLRPILMTASAAILGMLPIATGLGRGSEVQAPMATAVIGGLATSTFLTLFVVPVAYSLLDDLAKALTHREDS
jgi:HAE1 family hydrophobic/amphiphilic exporter-1